MTRFVRLKSNRPGAVGVVLVQGETATGYKRRLKGVLEGVLGEVVQEAIMASSIDQSPVKVGQREGSRVFPELVEITGADWADYVAKRDALVAEIRDVNEYGGRLRVRGEEAAAAVEFDVQHIQSGPLHSAIAEMQNRHEVELQFTCSPYALGDPMDVADAFDTDTLGTGGLYNNGGADWTVRSGSVPTVTGGYMVAAAGSAAAVVEHSGTPYALGDNQQTIEFQWTAQASGNAAGVILKRLADGSHLRVVVDDNGTTSTLRIQKVTSGGVATNLGTPVALAARVPANTSRWLRGRIEGNAVIAEYRTTDVAPLEFASIASSKYAHTLTGADLAAFGDGIEGTTGLYLAPTATASIRAMSWSRYAFTYAGLTSTGVGGPTVITSILASGRVPGDASAEVAVRVGAPSLSGDRALVVGSMPRRVITDKARPFGVFDSAARTFTSGTVTDPADAAASGGTVMLAGSASASAMFAVDTEKIVANAKNGVILTRVIARVRIAADATVPTIRAYETNVTPIEFGATARSLAAQKPTAGTAFRMVNLGTLPIPLNAYGNTNLYVEISSGVAGTIALDSVVLLAAADMSLSPVAVASTGLPELPIASPYVFRSDSGLAAALDASASHVGWEQARRFPGMVGSRIVAAPGEQMQWVVMTSTLPVDVSDGTTAASQTFGAGRVVQFSVQPRYWIGG